MAQQTMTKFPTALLFGSPGVGKGTQGRILDAIPGFHHVASGDLFRSLDPESEEGREAAAHSRKGNLVPDELTIQIFHRVLIERVNALQYRPDAEMLLLDGIPRTVQQSKCLDDLIDVRAVVSFVYSDENAMVERMKTRAVRENRSDDADEETIRRRFEVYRAETQPVLNCYPSELITNVDALRAPAQVLRDVLDCLIPIWPAPSK